MGDDPPTRISEASHLREEAAQFRNLALAHEAAGNSPIAAKLNEVAAKLEAKADELERGEAEPPRSPTKAA